MRPPQTPLCWVDSRYSWVYPIKNMTLIRSYVRHSNIYTIFEGTSEIQRLVIARSITGVRIK